LINGSRNEKNGSLFIELERNDFGLDDQISDEKTNFRKIQPRLPAKEE
jgi:hypothetical protein